MNPGNDHKKFGRRLTAKVGRIDSNFIPVRAAQIMLVTSLLICNGRTNFAKSQGGFMGILAVPIGMSVQVINAHDSSDGALDM